MACLSGKVYKTRVRCDVYFIAGHTHTAYAWFFLGFVGIGLGVPQFYSLAIWKKIPSFIFVA